jgi:hypothetical protein
LLRTVWLIEVPRNNVAQAVDLPRLLSIGSERRGEEAASQGPEERSSVHHSIT